jgi:ankyrin repeat protein
LLIINSKFNLMDNFLQQHSCVSRTQECNLIRPVSELEFYLENPSTGHIYTEQEKQDKLNQYNNMCGMNDGNKGKCCNPFDSSLNNHKNLIPDDLKQKYPKVKTVNTKNNETALMVCPDGKDCTGFREPTAYEYCKLSDATINNENIVESNVPDCLTANCNKLQTPYVITKDDINASNEHLEDAEIVRHIKDNNLSGLQSVLNSNKSKINKVLAYGFPGNTLLHEAIYRKSLDCIYYLLETMDKTTLDMKNQDGNTPLHIACLKGMKDIVNMLVKLGVNIHSKNKYGDNALMSSIRAGNEELVRYLLVIGGGLLEKNDLGENPLFISVITNRKNLNVIRLLCDNGARVLERNNKGNSMLTELKKQEDTVQNREIETYLVNRVFKYFENMQDYYKTKILAQYPEFSPFEIYDKDADKVTPKDYENVVISMDESLDDTELYKEKISVPQKILPESAKKYLVNSIEHFQGSLQNELLNARNMYIMVFIAILLVIAFFINNYV